MSPVSLRPATSAVAVALVLLLLLATALTARAAEPELPLDLPASFSGTLPCADCPGVDWHLDLWPDGRFHLARSYRERGGNDDALGRWRLGAAGETLELRGAAETPIALSVESRRKLRLLDRRGFAIPSKLPYALDSDGTLRATELRFSGGGEFRYMADAASLQECRTGHSYPVLMEGDYLALERAYGEVVESTGAPVYARVEGRIVNRQMMEGEGAPQSLRVEHFIAVQPSMQCARAMSDATLANTYWRLLRAGDRQVERGPRERESHLIFNAGQGRLAGLAGCNRLSASWRMDGEQLTIAQLMSTRMLCTPPLDALERDLLAALEATRSWRIRGAVLELRDGKGETLAAFAAVYLP